MSDGRIPGLREKSWRKQDDMKITGQQRLSKQEGGVQSPSHNPILWPIRHRDNHHPHLILGCPVVMFFNYVSLFNVAAAHPYLVTRCNFSCRVEMQPSNPGIKGQIEFPQAGRDREIYIYFYILSGYLCNLSHNRKIFSMPSNFQGKCEVWQFIHCTWHILFLPPL